MSVFLRPLTLAILMTTSLASADPCHSTFTTLEAARDCYRPLLVFAPSAADPVLKAQIDELRHHPEDLRERNVGIAIILPPEVSRPGDLPFTTLRPADEAVARRRFLADAGAFTIVLVGKDGGEKMRSSKFLPIESLIHTIDSMPMRQQEMQCP